MSASQHTPTPWEKDYGATKGHIKSLGMPRPEGQHWTPTPTVCRYDVETPSLSDAEKEANAAFIVRACNSHEALVKALEESRVALSYLSAGNKLDGAAYTELLTNAVAALKLAKT